MSGLSITSFDNSTEVIIHPASGAVVSSLKIQGEELLYWPAGITADTTTEICGGLPFIFPVCGRLHQGQYDWNGQVYTMPIHGFAHTCEWEVVEHSRNILIVLLVANERTRRIYPFDFGVCLKFQAVSNGLHIEIAIDNASDVNMPFYGGFHPYYRLPGEAQFHVDAAKSFAYNETLDTVVGEKAVLNMPTAADKPELNECLFELGDNRTTSLCFEDGSKLEQRALGSLFKYLQIYSPPGEGFICLEPWMGYPNLMNEKNVPTLKPGEAFVGSFSVGLSPYS